MPRRDPKPECALESLEHRKARCTCGAQFVISATFAKSVSLRKCQDALMDLYLQHRDITREEGK